MALSDTAIYKAKPGTKERKLADGKGLYLLLKPNGSKLWRLKYRFAGKERKLAIGQYPEVGVKDARTKAEEARKLIAAGYDPGVAKKEAALAASISAANTFKAVADEFIQKLEREGRAEATLIKARWLLKLLEPAIGRRPVAEITPHELLAVLKKVERKDLLETGRRLRSFASRVFRYAVATARADRDPAQLLIGALTTPTVTHHAAITDPKRLGELLRAIEGYSGEPTTQIALRLTPHVFQRPGEVRQAEWTEIDFGKAVWTIPAKRMKMRADHHVPLSRQALALLHEIQAITGDRRYVFPSVRSASRPMSENSINAALRRMDFSGKEMTAHGFRTTASSLLNESDKWNPDAIERALAHKDGNVVRGYYNRSPYWDERVRMAQWWSDHLDTLRDGAEIVPLCRRGA